MRRPCHASVGLSPVLQRGGLSSIQSHCLLGLWWTNWHTDMCFRVRRFPPSVSFDQCFNIHVSVIHHLSNRQCPSLFLFFIQFLSCIIKEIFAFKRDEVKGEWGRLHNEELHDVLCSPNIFQVIKSRRVRWTWHVARMVEMRGA